MFENVFLYGCGFAFSPQLRNWGASIGADLIVLHQQVSDNVIFYTAEGYR